MKMDDDQLLSLLQKKEEAAGDYVWGQLGNEREMSMREYHRMPYGNEEEGWSQIVSSDIQDTVEWILPSLLKIFTSTDRAVSFEPTKANDVEGAEQATDACNYVFYKQNNGFMVLYTAFKDALTVRNCAVMWRKEDEEVVSSVPFKQATGEMLAMLTQDDSEIQEANPEPMLDEMGQPVIDETGQMVEVYSGRLKKVETKTLVKVEAFSPEDLLVQRDWTSPLLHDCPYVCRMMRVTTSDLNMMGFKVSADELDDTETSDASTASRLSNINQDGLNSDSFDTERSDDESMAEGWLRIEFVLVDRDGDGVAERRCIYRLKNRILKDEVVSHVPIATFSPILNAHRWDGMSMADAVSDLQKLHTELLRQTLNNLYLSNNPRTKVLTDSNWSPLANIDDLLDSRPGGVIRQRDPNAVIEHVTPFSAGATLPMLEYVQGMRENRTGVTRYNQGLSADSLNKTASGVNQIMTASQQRIELIARIAAETLLKPIFAGILKLLTDGGMEKLAFRLRDEFIEYDPNEWRDQYDMTINVGLGTGDAQSKAAQLMMIAQLQERAVEAGLVTPENLYHTGTKIIENAGFKDVQNFITDPRNQQPKQPEPPQPSPDTLVLAQTEIQKATIKAESDEKIAMQKAALDYQAKVEIAQLNNSTEQHKTHQADIEAQREYTMDGIKLIVETMLRQHGIVLHSEDVL